MQEEKLQRAKEDLGDLEHFIEEFSAFLPLAVCTVTQRGVILYINQAFLRLTGYKEIEITGKEIGVLFENEKEWKDLEKEITKKELINGKETILVLKNRKKTPVSIYVSIRKDEKGVLIGYFLAFVDITEIKKLQEGLEEKVKEKTRELQARVEELEKFHKLAVGRELKMIELKKKIKELEEELEKYKPA